MRDLIAKSIEDRLEEEIAIQNPLGFLKEYQVEDYLDDIIATLFLYSRNRDQEKTYFVRTAASIGHRVRKKLNQPLNSALAVKAGSFFLYSFEKLGVIQVCLGQGRNRHGTYIINVLEQDVLMDLWKSVSIEAVEKLPSETPYKKWVTFKHETEKVPLIKTTSKNVLKQLTIKKQPIIFEVVNKAQEVGWKINKDVYKIMDWALRNGAEAFNDIWNQTNKQAKETKLREANTVLSMANRFLDKSFYHLYNYDFR